MREDVREGRGRWTSRKARADWTEVRTVGGGNSGAVSLRVGVEDSIWVVIVRAGMEPGEVKAGTAKRGVKSRATSRWISVRE